MRVGRYSRSSSPPLSNHAYEVCHRNVRKLCGGKRLTWKPGSLCSEYIRETKGSGRFETSKSRCDERAR